MRCAVVTSAIAAVALAAPTVVDAGLVPVERPVRADAVARLVACNGANSPMGRSLSVDSVMRSLRSGDRMQMRFDLLQRVPGALHFRRLPGPGLGSWNAATPGVQRYRFRKPIQNLPAPAVYYVRVRYRWKDATSQTFAAATRTTGLCRQADVRPDLRVVSVGAPSRLSANVFTYPVVVHNAGRGPSGDFDALVTIGDQPQAPRTIVSLAAGERRTVELTGPRCPTGTAASIQLDPDNRVDESAERNNVGSFTCS